MWRLVEVDGEKCMMRCINTFHVNHYEFILYNGTTGKGFKEELTISDLLKRSMELNRLVRYPQDVVIETLTCADPVLATLEMQPTGSQILSLKYKVENLPLNYQWNIESMTPTAQWECIAVPMLETIRDLSSQVNELRQCVQKKDVEISQYKIEGFKIRRTTVATEKFNFDKFDEQYKETDMQVKGYNNITDYLMESTKLGQERNNIITEDKINEEKIVKEDKIVGEELSIKKESPRNRKRKINEFGEIHLQRKVMQRRAAQQLEYKDSQSQSQSQNESENESKSDDRVGVEMDLKQDKETKSSTTNDSDSDSESELPSSTNDLEDDFEPLVWEPSSDDEN